MRILTTNADHARRYRRMEEGAKVEAERMREAGFESTAILYSFKSSQFGTLAAHFERLAGMASGSAR